MKFNGQIPKILIGWAIIIGLADIGTLSVASASPLHSELKSWLMAHPWATLAGLNQVLTNYCAEKIPDSKTCFSSAKKMTQILDLGNTELEIDVDEKIKLSVIFQKEIIHSLEMPQTKYFLYDFNRDLENLIEEVDAYALIQPSLITPVVIPQIANRYYDELQTWKTLGAFFQDIPQSRVQIYWTLQHKKDFRNWPVAFENLELLNQALLKIEKLGNKNGYQFLRLTSDVPMNSEKLYHQVVPASLAAQLKASGVPHGEAILIPYYFNFIYEAQADQKSIRFLFEKNPEIKNPQNILDIQDGLYGAQIGAN